MIRIARPLVITREQINWLADHVQAVFADIEARDKVEEEEEEAAAAV